VNAKNFFAQLKRRNVYKVAIAYAVVAWLLMQVASEIFPFFEIPNWAVRLVVLLLLIGFPVALILAWAFELTPEGIKRTEDVDLSPTLTRRTGRKLDFFIIAVLLLVIGFLLFQRLHPKVTPAVSSSVDKSIAVLPFENLSEEKANAYFAEGIQNEILTKLATVRDLKVISRTSTAKYQSKPDNLKTVAQELGVSTIVEGAVQKAGDKVRVNVQLIDARADTHLWAKSYDRDLKDVLGVESEVSQEIADALQANLSLGESQALASVQTHDAEAYDLFLRGEYELHKVDISGDADASDRAEAFYRQALARDPNFADAAAELARIRLSRHWLVSPLPRAELEEVKSLIDRALTLAPNSPEAHFALGLFFYWGHRQYESALTEFKRVLKLQPNNVLARRFSALVYRRRGEWERSVADFQQAQELDPRNPEVPENIGENYLALRLWKDAERAELRALSIDPHDIAAAEALFSARLNATGDVESARETLAGFPEVIKSLTLLGRRGANASGDITSIINMWLYLDVMERHFTDAFQAFDKEVVNDDRARLQRLAGRAAFASWQDRPRQPNQGEKKRGCYSKRGSGSGRTTLSR
jgi:TolB-like protein/Tfp pilus assembly protein PilF